jgi:hypothetical protein
MSGDAGICILCFHLGACRTEITAVPQRTFDLFSKA